MAGRGRHGPAGAPWIGKPSLSEVHHGQTISQRWLFLVIVDLVIAGYLLTAGCSWLIQSIKIKHYQEPSTI